MTRTDAYVGLSVALAIILIALWHWLIEIAAGLLLIGLVVVLMRAYMLWQHHAIEIEAKRMALVPITTIEEIENDNDVVDEIDTTQKIETTKTYKLFSDFVADGLVGPDKDFVVGFSDQGNPMTMPKLSSLGIGGGQGFGKTVTTLVLMMEAIAKYSGHIRFLVVDPHMNVAGDESLMAKISPLSPFFLSIEEMRATLSPDDHDYHRLLSQHLSNPVEGGEALRRWMQIVQVEMERRLNGKVGDTWVIVMDEFAALMSSREAGLIASVIEEINRQARKMNMFSLLVSQEWKATRTGGSELRHSVVSFVLHNMPEQISSLILPDSAKQTAHLEVGEVVLFSKGKMQRGRVPYADQRDAERVVAQYHVTRQPASFLSAEPANSVPTKTEIPMEFALSELKQIRELYVKGLNETDIAKAVYGVKSGPELAEARIGVRKQLEWLVLGVQL